MKHKIGNILMAILIAFGLWLYVITVVSPNQERFYSDIPVILQNTGTLTDRGLMILSNDTPTVNLTLAGTRSDLNKITNENLALTADLSSIYEPGEYLLHYNVATPGDVPTGAVSAQKSPDRVTVTVVRRITREVPVKINYQGAVKEGYLLDKSGTELDHEVISITGPEEVVEKIDHAAITVNCEGRTESLGESYVFVLQDADNQPVDAKHITTNTGEIWVQIRITQTKTIPLTLTIQNGGGATEQTAEILIDPVEITISGSESALAELESINLGTIDLADIESATTLEFPITLPEGVENENRITKAIVTISFPELATATFDITRISVVNVESGMEADLLTKVMTVTVRGPAAQIQKLRQGNITVTVDLSGVTGTETVEPTITFSDSFPDVGAVGKYSISVSVAPIPETTAQTDATEGGTT